MYENVYNVSSQKSQYDIMDLVFERIRNGVNVSHTHIHAICDKCV